MNITLHNIKISELYDGYEDNDEDGVVGYDGKLDIRPKYQREFVYDNEKRNKVIESVQKGLPLNVMYWAKIDGEDRYELLDGQQRTVSICSFLEGDFSVNSMLFDNLPKDKQQQILDYELFIYICEGTDSEKLEWFQTINIATETLKDQELLNAIYAGSWTTAAKRYFSKRNSPAANLAGDYLTGEPKRQAYLETALKWIADRDGIKIKDYMAQHQHDGNANELWSYFRAVIEWVKSTFPKTRSQMKGLPWGIYYNKHGQRRDLNPDALEAEIQQLLKDKEVQKKSAIYEYLLTRDEKKLNLRAFDDDVKEQIYEEQDHKCVYCGKTFELNEMEGDHITPWSQGGKTIPENCQMLCKTCNRSKGAK